MPIHEIISKFQLAMAHAGLDCGVPIIPDGELHRFKNEGDNHDNSWYVLHGSSLAAGAFGCWKRDINEKWCSKSIKQLSPEEHKSYEAKIEAAKKAQEAEREKVHAKSKKKAQEIWEQSTPTPAEHPYLLKKRAKPYGIRLKDENLVIPLRDHNGEMQTLQYIFPDGNKRFLGGGATTGNYYSIGKPTDKLFICEGYATGATIHEATDCGVIVAFNVGNLLPVTQAIKNKYQDKDIIVCADNDAYSEDNKNIGVEKATIAAKSIGAKLVVPGFKDTSTKPTDFNDLMVLESIDEVRKQLANANIGIGLNAAIPDGYCVNDGGVFFEPLDKEGNPLPKIFICSKIDIVACTRDTNSLNHGRLLQFNDTNGEQHQWAMPMEALAGDGVDYRRILLNMGARLNSGKRAREKLTDYFSNSQPTNITLCVNRMGWYQGAFVFPDGVIGNAKGEKIIYQSMSHDITGFKIDGSLEDWRSNISKFCVGNSRLILAISAAFAAPLLDMLNEESGGFHLNGASSTGKTTVLKVACSVWGERERLQNWRATSNGLEGVASLHNDSLLCLDEMSQIDPRDAGETAYMLANGTGKNRSKKDGSLQRKALWKLLFISSGEIGLAEHISQTGKKAKAGQQIRLLDIPADAGKNLGIFENLHGFGNGSELARHLDQMTKIYYGAPIREFLKILIKGKEQLIKNIEELRKDFIDEISISSADGQVKRAANRFSLIAAAGELATALSITDWINGEAIQAVKKCFQDWVNNRGGSNSQEELQAISQIKEFFQKNHPSRFISWNDCLSSKVINKAGFYKANNINDAENRLEFFVETEIFKKEICMGLNYQQAAKACIEQGWLIPDKSGKLTSACRAPDTNKTRRFYHFSDKVFGGENEE